MAVSKHPHPEGAQPRGGCWPHRGSRPLWGALPALAMELHERGRRALPTAPDFGSGDRAPAAPSVTKPSGCCGPGSVSWCCSAWQRGLCLGQGPRRLVTLTASHGCWRGDGCQFCNPVLPPWRETTTRNLLRHVRPVTRHHYPQEKSSFTPETPLCAKMEVRMVNLAMPTHAGGATPKPALAPRTAPLHKALMKIPGSHWAPPPTFSLPKRG